MQFKKSTAKFCQQKNFTKSKYKNISIFLNIFTRVKKNLKNFKIVLKKKVLRKKFRKIKKF